MADIHLRPAVPDDLSQIFQIDQLSSSLPWTERSYHFELTQNQAARVWVAVDETDRLIGFLVLWLIVDEAHIANIAVDPENRRRGAARRLMNLGLTRAWAEGARTSFLEVRYGNRAARELYRSLGYQETGIRARYYRDTHEDAVLMTLETAQYADLVKQNESI